MAFCKALWQRQTPGSAPQSTCGSLSDVCLLANVAQHSRMPLITHGILTVGGLDQLGRVVVAQKLNPTREKKRRSVPVNDGKALLVLVPGNPAASHLPECTMLRWSAEDRPWHRRTCRTTTTSTATASPESRRYRRWRLRFLGGRRKWAGPSVRFGSFHRRVLRPTLPPSSKRKLANRVRVSQVTMVGR